VAAGETAGAGESAVVVVGDIPGPVAGDIPGAMAGDMPGATEGAPRGEPKGAMLGAVVAGLRPRAGVASGAMEGGAAGDMAGDGDCARLASASEKEQRQTVSSVFIIMDGLEDRLDSVTGFYIVIASQLVASRGKILTTILPRHTSEHFVRLLLLRIAHALGM